MNLKSNMFKESITAVDKEFLNHLFPFHFTINDQMVVETIGPSLFKLIGNRVHLPFTALFSFKRPEISVKHFCELADFTGKLVILTSNTDQKFLLRGELIYVEKSSTILFCGSPWFANTEELIESKLEINDFSIQDPMIDMLYLIQSKEIDYADLQALLKRTKQQKEELQNANANLQKHAKILANSNAELGRFAYAASHDLQEPLRMITSFLNLLEKKYQDTVDESGKRYIEFAVNGANRMRNMIVDLLEYSRAGRINGIMENVDINTLVEEIIEENKSLIDNKKVEIEYVNLPTLKNYRNPITQVFKTLIDFGINNAKIEVTSKIKITCENKNNFWVFCIKDNGKGLDSKQLRDLFLILKANPVTADTELSAYSLPIIKKIIENQGGEIWVKSELGIGSEFYFTIPLNR